MRERIARATLALLAGALVFGAPVAHAATIGFSPSSTTVTLGDSFSVGIVISDLSGEIVSAYDLDLIYDDSIILATGVTFGPLLGEESFFEVFNFADVSLSGVVDLSQLSLLLDADLFALQGGDSFILATLDFDTVAEGISALDFDFSFPNEVAGSDGQVLDVASNSGSVTVPIPEPTGALLFALGCMVAFVEIRNRQAALH